jgi:hypothetical protein
MARSENIYSIWDSFMMIPYATYVENLKKLQSTSYWSANLWKDKEHRFFEGFYPPGEECLNFVGKF